MLDEEARRGGISEGRYWGRRVERLPEASEGK